MIQSFVRKFKPLLAANEPIIVLGYSILGKSVIPLVNINFLESWRYTSQPRVNHESSQFVYVCIFFYFVPKKQKKLLEIKCMNIDCLSS